MDKSAIFECGFNHVTQPAKAHPPFIQYAVIEYVNSSSTVIPKGLNIDHQGSIPTYKGYMSCKWVSMRMDMENGFHLSRPSQKKMVFLFS